MNALIPSERPYSPVKKLIIIHGQTRYERTFQPSQRRLEQKLARKIAGPGIPIINSFDEKDIMPGCFRMSSVVPLPAPGLNTQGLGSLHISGSAQPSQHSFRSLKRRIPGHITVVNLKQEDGGFIEPRHGQGAIAFSYMMNMPWWVKENRQADVIDQSEQARCKSLSQNHKITVYGIVDDNNLRKEKHTVTDKITIKAQRVFTEKQLAQEEGFNYLRIPDKKFGHMEYEHVDLLINFVKSLPEEEHVHFHCKRGQSRTTLFMTMFDMLKNADEVSADDIIKRQGPSGLSGADLTKLPDPSHWEYNFKKGWLDFLHTFHAYARENKPLGFTKSWSDWAREHNIPQPSEVPLDRYEGATVISALPDEEDADPMNDNPLVLITANEGKVSIQNFRTMQDLQLDPSIHINMTGLDLMKASGSSQYSEVALALLMKKLASQTRHVAICDLRHDDHLFVDGKNVSGFQTKGALLSARTPEDIIQSVNALRDSLRTKKGIKVRAIDTKYPKDNYDKRFSLRTTPHTVETPQDLVTRLGGDYLLIGSKRFADVADDDLDRVLEYVKTMPEDTWIHFHCRKGKSRTTFFMALYDLLRNADKVSMEDVVRRQHLIGGINLFDVTPKDPTWPQEKLAKRGWIITLARFHTFAQKYIQAKANEQPLPTWKAWSESHADVQPDVDHLLIDKSINESR